jgi:hypothetical protein
MRYLLLLLTLSSSLAYGQIFSDDFGTGFASISTVNWPTACRNAASSFNTSAGPCAAASDYSYGTSGFGTYITTLGIAIPATGYELTFDYSFNLAFSFPTVEIRTGGPCGTVLASSTTLTNTSGVCTPQTIDLTAFSGQTIYIRFRSNTGSATTYWDNTIVDLSSGGGGGPVCLLTDDFGSAFASIDATNWPASCRAGTASGFNTSSAPCGSVGERAYSLSGFGSYITSMALAIPSTGFALDFEYSFNNTFSFPTVEIRTGGPCGTTLASATTLTNTSGACTAQNIDLSAYNGQTIYIRFRSNTSSAAFFLDEVQVCGTGGSGIDQKWADNFNDNDLVLDYTGIDGDEDCAGCGDWTLNGGASLNLVPAGGWNGNSNETEAFVDNMANVYYVKLDRDEWIESPTIDLSGMSSVKISFYAKSSSAGTGGGDSWSSFSDHLRLQIWDGSAWITVKDITEGTSVDENKISPALPFNYFCFSAYKDAASPGNYYYNSTPNVNSAYFHSDFKYRVIFEGGFSGAPFAWVDDFTFRTDADGYSTMIPCGISFWNQPAATSYGQDLGITGNNNAEKGVELELDNSINIPPVWASEANDGDTITQVFGSGESERVVFAVLSEQKIQFAFPRVHYYAPDIGNQSAVLSLDNTYSGPGYRYYNVQYISCDLASASIAAPTNDFRYHYSFEYGNEFIPVFYQLNTSGIETGGGVTSTFEQFNAPDVNSTDDCGLALGVELDQFDAQDNTTTIFVSWSTLSERNADYFEVEKSNDGVNYRPVEVVKAAGNSSETIQYSINDFERSSGVIYYRLQQVDFDGATTFYGPKSVMIKSESIYPNPSSNGVFYIQNDLNTELISVKNSIGQSIGFNIEESNDGLLLKLMTTAKGVYFLSYFTKDGIQKTTTLLVNE